MNRDENWWNEHDMRIRAETKLKCLQGQYNVMKKMYDKCFNYFNDKYPDEMGNVLDTGYELLESEGEK